MHPAVYISELQILAQLAAREVGILVQLAVREVGILVQLPTPREVGQAWEGGHTAVH